MCQIGPAHVIIFTIMKKSFGLINKKYFFSLTIILMGMAISGFLSAKPKIFSSTNLYSEAIKLYYKENYTETISLLSKNKKNISTPKKYFLMGKAYSNLGYNNKALKEFNKAQKALPDIKDAIVYEKARLSFKSSKLKKAEEQYSSIINAPQKSSFLTKSKFDLAEIKFIQRDFDYSIELYNELVINYPTHPLHEKAMYRLSTIYELINNSDAASFTYYKMKELYPNSEYKIATFSTKVAKKGIPHTNTLLKKAKTYRIHKEFEKSNLLLKTLVNNYPYSNNTPEAILTIMYNRYDNYDFIGSIATATTLMKKYPRYKHIDKAYYYKAKALKKLNDLKKANIVFNDLIKKYPNSDLCAPALYNKADIYRTWNQPKKETQAYKRIYTTYKSSYLADDALWSNAYHYIKQKNYSTAYKILKNIEHLSNFGDLTAKCYYWAAKCADKVGLKKESTKLYKTTYKKHPNSYYSYRVWQEKHPSIPTINILAKEENNNTISKRTKLLIEFGYINEAKAEYKTKKLQGSYIPFKLLISKNKYMHNSYTSGIRELETSVKKNLDKNTSIPKEAIQYTYPKAYWDEVSALAEKYEIDPFLILALAREESRFNPYAKSKSNALGLMQLMPATAKHVAQQLKIKYKQENNLYDPETNLKLGTHYLSYLLERFDKNVYLALAGYNGGPTNTHKWWNNRKTNDIDEFIESIPLEETRFYIQKVLSSYWIYKKTYSYDTI